MKRTRSLVAWKHTLSSAKKSTTEEESLADQLLDMEYEVAKYGLESLSPIRKSIYMMRNEIRGLLINGNLTEEVI